MDELTRVTSFVAVGRLEWLEGRSFAGPIRRNTADTVEIGIVRHSAISAAVIRR